MPIRTMIFDFDGTLAGTFEPVLQVLDGLADEFGYRRAQPGEIPELMKLSVRELAERMNLSWHRLPLLAARVRKEMTRMMPQVKAIPGIETALSELRGRGVRLGILTSNKRENVDVFLANHPQLVFDFISTGSGLFSKHHRLAKLLKQRKLALAETCYVGDEVRDIEAARELGMTMVAVSWGFSASQLLAASHPQHLLHEPSELLTLV